MSWELKPESKLRELRKARGYTQAELARRAGVNQGTISLLEMQRYAPSEEIIGKVANALDVTPEEILEESAAKRIQQKKTIANYITISQIEEALCVSRNKAYDIARQIGCIKIGGLLRVRKDAYEQFIERSAYVG